MRASKDIQVSFKSMTTAQLPASERIKPEQLRRISKRVAGIVKKIEAERRAGRHRYRDLPYDRKMLSEVRAAVRRYQPGCRNVVVLGIGGSALGNKALQSALNPPNYNLLSPRRRGGPRLFVLDNVDPMTFTATLDVIGPELKNTVFNVISKSGETAETASQFLVVRDLLSRRLGVKAATSRILVTTDRHQGTMRSIVDHQGYSSLPVPEGVGGRFSVLSAVGLFSAGMCGIDPAQLLKGAAAMDKPVSRQTLRTNPAAMIAATQYLYYNRGKHLSVMFAYGDQLKELTDWYCQLWAESLGKRYAAGSARQVYVGPTPIKAVGATDQHSQVQLYREGPNDKAFTFLEVKKFARDVRIPKQFADVDALAYLGGTTMGTLLNVERQATERALTAAGRPAMTVTFPTINPYTVGQFIYLYESATTIAGRLFGVDPYDQPGVELGKKITYHLMGRAGYKKMPKA